MISILFLSGCKKYLDLKSNQSFSVPDNLEDIELLLNNVGELNTGMAGGNAGSDEYYLFSNDWESLDQFNKESYVWHPQTQDAYDWNSFYKTIFNANTVLENLEKIERATDPLKWDDFKGRALFLRAFCFYQLLQVYAPHYPGNENSELGLPIRLNADFNQPVKRSTLKDSYTQLVIDIESSIPLLFRRNTHVTQPSRWAAFALLARVYLLLGNYKEAYNFSDSCLNISSDLIDYNTIADVSEFPLPGMNSNPEVIYHTFTDIPINAYYFMVRVDSGLHKSFTSGDIRRNLFFINNGDGTFSFRGNYTGSYFLFNGLAVDEVYLIRAEAAVRTGKIAEALASLNALLSKRWEPGEYDVIDESDPEKLLRIVLEERRKELMFRGLRWSDLRRLNMDARFRKTITRSINGETFSLAPNDLRYVFLIPQQSINISGIPQNPR